MQENFKAFKHPSPHMHISTMLDPVHCGGVHVGGGVLKSLEVSLHSGMYVPLVGLLVDHGILS